jgi:hypothetical protein
VRVELAELASSAPWPGFEGRILPVRAGDVPTMGYAHSRQPSNVTLGGTRVTLGGTRVTLGERSVTVGGPGRRRLRT